MNITTIVARVLGAILLLLSLVFVPAGRICFRQIYEILLFWREKTLGEVEEQFAGSIIHREIFRTFRGFSISRDVLGRKLGTERFEFDNSQNRIIDAVRITIFRWCNLPFFVGLGLILSGSLWWILVLPIAWIVTFDPFCQVGIYTILMVTVGGWLHGNLIFSYFPSTSKLWYGTSHAMGVLFLFMALLLIEIILWFPNMCPLKKRKLGNTTVP
jgi:hypothetical protein